MAMNWRRLKNASQSTELSNNTYIYVLGSALMQIITTICLTNVYYLMVSSGVDLKKNKLEYLWLNGN